MPSLELPAGVYKTPTAQSKSANWWQTNYVRWEQGRMTPIGGWEAVSYDIPFASRVREILDWLDNAGNRYIAYLCEAHLYVDIGGVLTDISPDPEITPPYENVNAGGYGTFAYNLDNYGDARPDRVRDRPITPAYRLSNWGEDLLAMTSVDGRLLRWSPSTPNDPAEPVTNAPVSNRTFVVTPERFVILFGAGGNRGKWQWCDQEDIEEWTISNTTKAGSYEIEPYSPILDAVVGRAGVVFHTAKKAYTTRFIGAPFYYEQGQEIGDSSTPISAASIVSAGDLIYWVSENGWWAFNGVAVQPVNCDVWSFVKDNINNLYSRYEACLIDITVKSEIWWFYVSKDARYNDLAIVFNYRDGWWAMHKLSRTCGIGSSYTTFPIMSDGEKIYLHEKGEGYPGAAEPPWAETFTINALSGDRLMTLKKMIPNIVGNYEDIVFRFRVSDSRRGPGEPDDSRLSTKKRFRSDGIVEVRETGRDMRMRIESEAFSAKPWTFGNTILDAVVRGTR